MRGAATATTTTTTAAATTRAAVNKTISGDTAAMHQTHHHMDDDELKKASTGGKKSGSSLVRRYSDLSSSSGSTARSTASARNMQTAAKLAEKIPETFGKSDQEVRVTRSKLKTLLEPGSASTVGQDDSMSDTASNVSASSAPPTSSGARLTRRNSRRQQHQPPIPQLEQVKENEELQPTTTKMSVHNLRKHNAAMDKLNEDGRETEAAEDETKQSVRINKNL